MFTELCIICCLCVVWKLWIRKPRLEPPELSGRLPLIGHGHLIMGDGVKMYQALVRFSEECLEKGGVVTLQLGPIATVYGVADPEDTLTIMSTCLEKHYYWDFSKPLIGNGILTAKVSTWKKNRKLLTLAFNQQVLDSYLEIFNTQARNLVKQFAPKEGKPFDQEIFLRMYALQAICATACRVDPNEYVNFYYQYLNNIENFLESVNQRLLTIWYHNDFMYNMTPEKKKLDQGLKKCLALSKSIIKKKKSEKTSEIKEGKLKSFIDLTLDLGDSGYFTDEQIREEIDTLIMAAHDTTATTLTFALALLGSYSEVQQKAYEEILHVCGNSDKSVTKDGLSKLVYVEAVLKETLRLYPLTIVIARHIDKDIKLKNYKIKAHSDCFILLHGLHHHSIWGPDADLFKPERWLDKDTLPDPKYYGAFGLGRRSCIGKTYAMMSMKTVVSHVLRKYRVSSDVSQMVPKFHTMTRPESGHCISLDPREL